MAKINVLDKDFIAKRNALAKEIGSYDGKIDSRVDYIVRKICSVFNKDLSWYDYQGGGEDGGGTFDSAIRYGDDQLGIDYHFKGDSYSDLQFIDKDNDEWNLIDSIPLRWLYEDFEDELEQGKKKYKERQEERKLKAAETKKINQQKRAELAAQAKAKLSKEELKALLFIK